MSGRSKFPLGKTFYVIRHAETADNEKGVVSGSGSATMLTEKGEKQAILLQQVLPKLDPPIDRIVTSEMDRAIKTAKLACNSDELKHLHEKTVVDSNLNERNYGSMEGVTEAFRQKMKAEGKIEGQEEKEAQQVRVKEAIKHNIEKDGIPLLVTHGGNILRMIGIALGEETVKLMKTETDIINKDNAELIENGIINKRSVVDNCRLYKFTTPQEKGGRWEVKELKLEDQKIKPYPVVGKVLPSQFVANTGEYVTPPQTGIRL